MLSISLRKWKWSLSVKPTTTAGVRTPSASVYTLGTNPAERERLRRQSHDLEAHSLALLGHVDLPPGGRALDLGCGPAGTIELLAERVGPTGSVTAIDIDPAHVAMARRLVQDRGLANVEVLQADARHTGLPSDSFDVVHARLLWSIFDHPNKWSPRWSPGETRRVDPDRRSGRPGGDLLSTRPRMGSAPRHPPRRLPRRRRGPLHRSQADRLLRQAGLTDVGADGRADVYPAGHARRTLLPDLVRSMRAKIVEAGIASEDELAQLDRRVRAASG